MLDLASVMRSQYNATLPWTPTIDVALFVKPQAWLSDVFHLLLSNALPRGHWAARAAVPAPKHLLCRLAGGRKLVVRSATLRWAVEGKQRRGGGGEKEGVHGLSMHETA